MNHAGSVAVEYRQIESVENECRFQLTVTDSGVGMSDDAQRRALEPLFTATETGSGSGFGLAIVREIVDALDGQIKIDSQLGFGVAVAIVVPKFQLDANAFSGAIQ